MKSSPYSSRLLLVLLIACIYGCSKTSSNSQDSGNQNFVKTPVGTPVGNPVTKTIGASGGKLTSADGELELTIPAGALTSNTDISIQQVTNEMPGGIGFAYDLLPDGTIFKKAATITYHYKQEDINGDPFSLFIAFQNSAHEWLADSKNLNFDTIANTISLGIWHFTAYGLGDELKCVANPVKLKANETSEVTATEIVLEEYKGPTITVEGAPKIEFKGILKHYIQVPDNLIVNWMVNKPVGLGKTGGTVGGNAEDGFIIGTGGKVTYKAPAKIDKRRTVRVSFTMKRDKKINLLGKDHELPRQERGVEIELVPEDESFDYTVSFYYTDNLVSPFNPAVLPDIPVYQDKSSIHLKIKVKGQVAHLVSVDTSDLQNHVPTVTPPSKHYANVRYTWIPDSIGVINIASVIAGAVIGDDSIVHFTVYHSKTIYPGHILLYDGGLKETAPPFPLGDVGHPQSFKIDLKRKGGYSISYGPKVRVTIVPE